jgi:hypothetical protein
LLNAADADKTGLINAGGRLRTRCKTDRAAGGHLQNPAA